MSYRYRDAISVVFLTQDRDLLHNSIRDFLIDLLQSFLGAAFRFFAKVAEIDGLAELDVDLSRPREELTPVPSFVGAENPHWHNRRIRFDDGQSHPGTGWLKVAVTRSGPFGEKNDASSF